MASKLAVAGWRVAIYFHNVVDGDIRAAINSGQNASAIWIYGIDTDKVPNARLTQAQRTRIWNVIQGVRGKKFSIVFSIVAWG